MRLSRGLSEAIFTLSTEEQLTDWIRAVDKEIGGGTWVPLGGIDNNVHTVEVASDPALALVERPTNSIDALLDLRARERGETARTPHDAAKRWWGVPPGGLSAMTDHDRRELADHARVIMVDSGTPERPTVVIQDAGTGQHPDDFTKTLLSLLESNKKSATHVMGVYNAGGAASYKFAKGTLVASRLAPQLLNGRSDEIGVSVVRYNPLDPDRFKSGVYEILVAKDRSILRLGVPEMPDLGHGTYVKLIEYLLPKYARAAHEPKASLWHLFHAALPDPALPLRIVETRVDLFPGMKGTVERRVVSGLLHLLRRPGTADYSDEREIDLGGQGRIILRYFVLNPGSDPDAYTTSDQGLTVMLNGQRQMTKDRYWLRRQLDLFFIYKRLVVLVDCTALTNAAKREVFASTRETGADVPLAKTILDRVIQELTEDENLDRLDEEAKQKTLEAATKTTTDKVKRQLATQIAAYMKGELGGGKGGLKKKERKGRRRRHTTEPVRVDDSQMLDVPDRLVIVTDPLKVEQGGTASLRLEINAKNDFLPKHADGLSVIFSPEHKDHVRVLSKGRLLGGRVRITVEATRDAYLGESKVKVALVVQELGVLLTAEGTLQIVEREEDKKDDAQHGGEPNIEVHWVGRDKWDSFDPAWDAESVGDCIIHREDPNDRDAITKVEWILNEAFLPYEKVIEDKKLGDAALRTFKEGYEYPVLFGLFKQRLAEEAKEAEADEEGRPIDIPDDYVKGEKARLARAALMAMEPEVSIAEAAER